MEIVLEDKEKQLRKIGFIKGLLLGAIILVVGIISYYLVVNNFGPWWFPMVSSFFFGLILPAVIAAIFALNLRTSFGGFWSFKQAVTGIFIMFLAAYIVQAIGRDVIFAKVIEPDMVPKTEAAMIRSINTASKQLSYTKAQTDAKISDTKKEFADTKSATVTGVIQGVLISIIFIFVFAIIFAAIFKREQPQIV